LMIGLDGEGEFIGSRRQIQGNRDGAIHELSGMVQNNWGLEFFEGLTWATTYRLIRPMKLGLQFFASIKGCYILF
jgi:hypothetical protein